MIDRALVFIKSQINEYLAPGGGVDEPIVLGNIAMHESASDTIANTMSDKTVISVVSIVEEATLKNVNHFKVNNDSTTRYQNPTLHLNLFVLFSAKHDNYNQALQQLSKIIAFFQRQHIFTAQNSPTLSQYPDIEKLIFDMHSLSFEQLNNLWGYLGGKYIPSVLYLVRLIGIQSDPGREAPIIENLGEMTKSI